MLSMRLRLGKKAVVVLACLLFVGVGAVCFAILFGGSSFVKSDPQLLTLRETESLIGLDVELEYVMKLYRTVPESGKVVPAPSERPVMTPWEPDEGSLYLGTEHRIHYWQHGKKVRWDSVHFPYSAWDEQKVQTREPYSASVIYGGVQMIERGKMIIGVDDKVARPYASIQRNAIMSLFSLRGIVTALTSGKISHNAPHMIDTPFNIFSFGTERLLTDAIDLMAKSVERTVEIADKIGYRIEYPKTSIQTLLGITRTETCDLYLDRARGCLPSAKIKFDQANLGGFLMITREWMEVPCDRFPDGIGHIPSKIWWQFYRLSEDGTTMKVSGHCALEVSRVSLDPVNDAVFEFKPEPSETVIYQ